MSLFDKLFSHKYRNFKNENVKTEAEPLSFRSSSLNISKDNIRFILFRECDRRGRKLLFDSNAVEKLPLPSKEIMGNQKCQQQSSERIIDFIETTSTHGYKYKKPSSDVACLGEMIFGSVAMVYKGENSCKIHIIPSPKRIMFTSIVHAPSRCPGNAVSESSLDKNSRGSSLASLNEIINQKETSSSDSKLYRREEVAQKYSSTYPWIRPNLPFSKLTQCCEISDVEESLIKKSLLPRSNEVGCLESLCLGNKSSRSNICNLIQSEKSGCSERLTLEEDSSIFCENNLNFSQKLSGFERDSTSNVDSSVSSVSGSLSSLRRRWNQSYTTSLDSVICEDTNSSPSKKRTKLGMALVLNLNNTLEDKIEKFLFNHTIIIDSIMGKLQSSVELAYIRIESFVDLIYSAFQESQQSIYELITGGKYESPLWCTLNKCSNNEEEENQKDDTLSKKQESFNTLQEKFLNAFRDVLVRFDTKDTNFFISTLLTAVLTHHLSWVSSIAETDISSPNEKLSVINNSRSYNPLWAQLNDLCGLLGSPLKSAKTVVTGAESKKCHITTIVQVLTYFIRCYDVIENVYELDIEEVIRSVDLERKQFMENFDSDIESDGQGVCASFKKHEKSIRVIFDSDTEKSSDDEVDQKKKEDKNLKDCMGVPSGLKRSKSYLSNLKLENSFKLYPNIEEMAKNENVSVADLEYSHTKNTVPEEKFSYCESLSAKINKMIRVPSKSVNPHLEGYLSPDEGYDTIDSTNTDNISVRKVSMEIQRSAPSDRKENIVFVLGENEELVNLQKKIVLTKSSVIDLEREPTQDLPVECDRISTTQRHAQPLSISLKSVSKSENNKRTCETLGDQNLVINFSGEKNEDCRNMRGDRDIPWTIPLIVRELRMPNITDKPYRTKRLGVSSILGGINQRYNSEQVIQGVIDSKDHWERTLQKDLFLCAHNSILEKNVNEALCIVGDMDSWEVSVFSSSKSTLNRGKYRGVRVGMSQLVADMLESFLYLHTINLSPSFCLIHIERKLYEIYLKSKTIAELLNTTELCSIDYLTTRLDIGINDVPLLLSVATTHSPQISEKYGLSFT